MRCLAITLAAFMVSPALATAQQAFFPNLSVEHSATPGQQVIQQPAFTTPNSGDAPMMTQPSIPHQNVVIQNPAYSFPQQTVNTPANQSQLPPNQRPEYHPPLTTSIVVSPAGGYPTDMYLGYWQPGHYRQLTGSPYFYSAPNAGPRGPLAGSQGGYAGVTSGYNYGDSYGMNYQGGQNIYSGSVTSYGGGAGAGGDPHNYHFGPGYYRSGEYGHYRFPFYSYRRPWYYPGFAGYNRDTNLPW
jgi:hypothetical protein